MRGFTQENVAASGQVSGRPADGTKHMEGVL